MKLLELKVLAQFAECCCLFKTARLHRLDGRSESSSFVGLRIRSSLLLLFPDQTQAL